MTSYEVVSAGSAADVAPHWFKSFVSWPWVASRAEISPRAIRAAVSVAAVTVRRVLPAVQSLGQPEPIVRPKR